MEHDKANEQSQTVTDTPVTDADLDSALEGSGQPETVVEPQADGLTVKPIEEEDHSEKSRLGRKVKRMEEQFSNVLERFDDFMSRSTPPQPSPPLVGSTDELPEFIQTPEDVERVVNARERKIATAQQLYSGNYIKQLQGLGNVNTEIHDDILNEMAANPNFNTRHTGNPIVDARLNYAEAKASVLAKKTAGTKPNIPVSGGSPIAPTGISATSRNAVTPTSDLPELSEASKEFIRRTGMSEEDVKAALTGNAPLSIMGGLNR